MLNTENLYFFSYVTKIKALLTEPSTVLTPLTCDAYSTRKTAFQTIVLEIVLVHAHL